jgi:nucleotide-binding universal stress UspA family protein
MKILLAVDGSAHSDVAVEEVARRQWPSETDIVVLAAVHTRVPLLPDPAFAMAAAHVERTHELTAAAVDTVNLAAGRIRREVPWVSVETKVVEGPPVDVILQEAREWGADLIVLGSHGRSPMRQAVLGSVASGVAAEASCAVEIIRGGRRAVTVQGAA